MRLIAFLSAAAWLASIATTTRAQDAAPEAQPAPEAAPQPAPMGPPPSTESAGSPIYAPSAEPAAPAAPPPEQQTTVPAPAPDTNPGAGPSESTPRHNTVPQIGIAPGAPQTGTLELSTPPAFTTTNMPTDGEWRFDFHGF